jgi:hypothetical protein
MTHVSVLIIVSLVYKAPDSKHVHIITGSAPY